MSKRIHNPKSHAPAVYIPCWLIQVPIKLLSLGSKITYGRLSQWSNDKGIVYRSAKQLGEELGTSYRSIEEYIKELKKVELIGTYHPQAGGLNYFEFYDHPWMHEPINENLVYKPDNSDPPQNRVVPTTESCGTPPHDRVVINKKEIKLNNNKHKIKSSCEKTSNLSIDEILKDNPHDLPEDLLVEWKKSRKKPITQRVLNAFNKELFLILESGITPLTAINKMLDKQWSTVELRFFANDIAFKSSLSQNKEKGGDSLSRIVAKYTNLHGGTFDEHGNSINAFGR